MVEWTELEKEEAKAEEEEPTYYNRNSLDQPLFQRQEISQPLSNGGLDAIHKNSYETEYNSSGS